MNEKICRWSDIVKCQEKEVPADDSNRAIPVGNKFLYCTECMLRDATNYLEEYDKLNFMKMNKESVTKYVELTEKAKILNLQWNEYWKEQERRGREGFR